MSNASGSPQPLLDAYYARAIIVWRGNHGVVKERHTTATRSSGAATGAFVPYTLVMRGSFRSSSRSMSDRTRSPGRIRFTGRLESGGLKPPNFLENSAENQGEAGSMSITYWRSHASFRADGSIESKVVGLAPAAGRLPRTRLMKSM